MLTLLPLFKSRLSLTETCGKRSCIEEIVSHDASAGEVCWQYIKTSSTLRTTRFSSTVIGWGEGASGKLEGRVVAENAHKPLQMVSFSRRMKIGVVWIFWPRQPVYRFGRLCTRKAPQVHLYSPAENFSLASDWGWYAEIKHNMVPLRQSSSLQKSLVKVTSRSLNMLTGMSCNLKMLSNKTQAILTAEYRWAVDNKWKYLEKKSTTTKITFFPREIAKPSTKSNEISDHVFSRTGKGWRRPAGCDVSVLCL